MFVLYLPYGKEEVVICGIPLDVCLYVFKHIFKVATGVHPSLYNHDDPTAFNPLNSWLRGVVKEKIETTIRTITGGVALLNPEFVPKLKSLYSEAIINDCRVGYLYLDWDPTLSYANHIDEHSVLAGVYDKDSFAQVVIKGLRNHAIPSRLPIPSIEEFLKVSIDSELRNTPGLKPLTRRALTAESLEIQKKYSDFAWKQ
uniref:Uncharacterized protein n=1 Tax=viral metagenome TaxID=1070528 RepID=A0A2V0RM06_9ZZZZ